MPSAASRDDSEPAGRRRASRAVLGVVASLVIVAAAALVVPRLLPDHGQVAAPAPSRPTDPAPAGWRTEFYRGISLQVPADWGYALDAQPCGLGGSAPPEYHRPFVSHGTSRIGDSASCAAAAPIEQEHVTLVAGPFDPPTRDQAEHTKDGFWLRVHEVGGVRAEVYTRDRALATRTVGSMTTAVPPVEDRCRPDSAVQDSAGSGPERPFDLAAVDTVRWIVLCQYDQDQGKGLRARAVVTGAPADQLLRQLRNEPTAVLQPCRVQDRTVYEPALALVVRLDTGQGAHDLHVGADYCAKDGVTQRHSFDGTTVRGISLPTCNLLLVAPIAWSPAGTYTGQSCS